MLFVERKGARSDFSEPVVSKETPCVISTRKTAVLFFILFSTLTLSGHFLQFLPSSAVYTLGGMAVASLILGIFAHPSKKMDELHFTERDYTELQKVQIKERWGLFHSNEAWETQSNPYEETFKHLSFLLESTDAKGIEIALDDYLKSCLMHEPGETLTAYLNRLRTTHFYINSYKNLPSSSPDVLGKHKLHKWNESPAIKTVKVLPFLKPDELGFSWWEMRQVPKKKQLEVINCRIAAWYRTALIKIILEHPKSA